jgi:penicillin-binding protein 1A
MINDQGANPGRKVDPEMFLKHAEAAPDPDLSLIGQAPSSGADRFRPPGAPGTSALVPMKLAGSITFLALLALAIIAGSLTGLMLVYSVDLPQIADLERYRPITTTDLLDVHGRVFGSFALERRIVVPYEALPPVLRQAVISIEDKNFESHWGVNIFRVLGAAYHDLTSNGRTQGASTLTMQLARNLFLSSQQTFGRKLQEVFLSIQIERAFTKEQIFTLYANQIYLGQGVYGFEAGSEYYFSKHARDLTLPEAALLAALPKGPVAYSPILNPDRAFRRRNMVINSMLEDGVITNAQANAAKAAPLGLHIEPPSNSVAPWFVEDVRRELERQFGSEQVHEEGLRVYTTLDLDLQQAANRAVLGRISRAGTPSWMEGQPAQCARGRRVARRFPSSGLAPAAHAGIVHARPGDECFALPGDRAHRAAAGDPGPG